MLGYSDMSFHADLYRERLAQEGRAVPDDPESDIWTPRVELVSGDQEIAKGVHLIETPGHTAGHYSLLVELAGRRPMLFTADAAYTRQGLEQEIIPSFHLDPVKAVALDEASQGRGSRAGCRESSSAMMARISPATPPRPPTTVSPHILPGSWSNSLFRLGQSNKF